MADPAAAAAAAATEPPQKRPAPSITLSKHKSLVGQPLISNFTKHGSRRTPGTTIPGDKASSSSKPWQPLLPANSAYKVFWNSMHIKVGLQHERRCKAVLRHVHCIVATMYATVANVKHGVCSLFVAPH
jgi:hypothetical protein